MKHDGNRTLSGPQKVFRLRYVVPEVEPGDPETNWPGGDPILDENDETEWSYERIRYYMQKSSLNRKLKELERWSDHMQLGWEPMVPAKVLSIDEGSVDWMAPDGHEDGPVVENGMRVETKRVYYCQFCGKHGLRTIRSHVTGCTANPDRECRWMHTDDPHTKAGDLRPLIDWCKSWPEVTGAEVDVLRGKVDGCPACMLAVLRIGRAKGVIKSRNFKDEPIEIIGPDYHDHFHYTEEVKRFNEELAERQYREEGYY